MAKKNVRLKLDDLDPNIVISAEGPTLGIARIALLRAAAEFEGFDSKEMLGKDRDQILGDFVKHIYGGRHSELTPEYYQ